MEYHEAANFLLDLRRFPPKPGIESVAALLETLGDPHEGTAYVQVAGSNGKGSTARMTESILREAGYTVGLYTSPHFDDFRERIRVDGRTVPKSAVVEFVETARPYMDERAADNESPTFFETLTALALWYFGTRDVDVAVLEVGIGGRYDATSVVDPVASAVTSVSLEHTDLLGDTVAEIARDKAQVAPDDAPLVTGTAGEALSAVRFEAGDLVVVEAPDGVSPPGDDTPPGGEDSPGGNVDPDEPGATADTDQSDDAAAGDLAPDVAVEYGGRTDHVEAAVSLAGPDWTVDARLPVLGAHQATNAGIAATLARQVGGRLAETTDPTDPGPVDETTVARGLRNAHWPGRFEIMQAEPLVVLDGAHNPGAAARTAATLAEFERDRFHLVVGSMHEKDHRGIAAALPTPDRALVTRPATERAEAIDVLASVYEDAGAGSVETHSSVASAVGAALDGADPGDCVLVTGSLSTVAEARERWLPREIPKAVDDLETADAVLADADVAAPGAWRMRGKAVHRVVRTRVRQRQAQFLKEELLSRGGECAVSALNDQHEGTLDVVCMGTLAQFKRVVEALEGQSDGLPAVAEDLRTALGIQRDRPAGGYPWEDGPVLMGVLNVTPDSFHDGGEYEAVEDAVARAESMVEAGAAIVDVGGESTRPGADPVPVDEERDRVVPVIEALADDPDVDAMLSVDTRKAAVARAALEAGADMLNDVSGLADPGMRHVAAEYDVPLVVMHSDATPVDPDREVVYDDVVEDVIAELRERVRVAEQAGLDRSQIIVDPGLGFGKAAPESFELLGRLGELRGLGCPVMVGHSHKSMFEHVGGSRGDAYAETFAGTAVAAAAGVDVIRVHDVAGNVQALRTALAARQPDDFGD